MQYSIAGTIVDINSKTRSLSVLCSNNKIITFTLNHYKEYDRPFASNYIKREMKIGQVL